MNTRTVQDVMYLEINGEMVATGGLIRNLSAEIHYHVGVFCRQAQHNISLQNFCIQETEKCLSTLHAVVKAMDKNRPANGFSPRILGQYNYGQTLIRNASHLIGSMEAMQAGNHYLAETHMDLANEQLPHLRKYEHCLS